MNALEDLAACARADAAEQTVAEMRAKILSLAEELGSGHLGSAFRAGRAALAVDELIGLSKQAAPVAGRWCLASERDEAVARADDAFSDLARGAQIDRRRVVDLAGEKAAATARAEKAEAELLDTARVLYGHVNDEGELVREMRFDLGDLGGLSAQAAVVRRLACLTTANRERAEKAEAAQSAAEQTVAEIRVRLGDILLSMTIGGLSSLRSRIEALRDYAVPIGQWCPARERDEAVSSMMKAASAAADAIETILALTARAEKAAAKGSPLSVICPRCGAKVGKDCVTRAGAKAMPHMSRRDDARLKAATRR